MAHYDPDRSTDDLDAPGFAPRSPVPATVALLVVTAGIAALTLLLEWSLREGR